jgi:hypothetical protein
MTDGDAPEGNFEAGTTDESELTDADHADNDNPESSYNDIENLEEAELSEEDFEGEEEDDEDEDLEELEELEAEYDEGMEEEYEAFETPEGESLPEEDDNTTYLVGEDGELIKEHTPPNTDDGSKDESDSEDKPDEEK